MTTATLANIRQLVKETREEKGLTHLELGELCGLNEEIIRNFEAGLCNDIGLEDLSSIYSALDLSILFSSPVPVSEQKDRIKWFNIIKNHLQMSEMEKLQLFDEIYPLLTQNQKDKKIP